VKVVSPGATKTPIWEHGQRTNQSPEESVELGKFISSLIPLERWGEATEIAKVVLFLASDDSLYVNSIELRGLASRLLAGARQEKAVVLGAWSGFIPRSAVDQSKVPGVGLGRGRGATARTRI
jgi:NAD(P)-dependent dehydrogenase (short-subunit alcohol dehydrogenase family)